MSTEKIYYDDPYQNQLSAVILDMRREEDSGWLLPDRTVFYPGGGGQLSDSGELAGKAVSDVRAEGDDIWHAVSDFSGIEKGQTVHMELNWKRRYYQMQQHTGQHLLSHILFDMGWNTLSVHLGEEYTMVEIDGRQPDPDQLQIIEERTNQLIREARQVHIHITDHETIQKFPLRRPAGDWQRLRVVEIEGKDYAACGGIHVRRTSEIGLIKIIGQEKIRGHARIRAVIGLKAYTYFQDLHTISEALKQQLKSEPQHFADRVSALTEEHRRLKREADEYLEQWATLKAQEMAGRHDPETPIVEHLDVSPEKAELIARQLGNNLGRISFIITDKRFYLTAPEQGVFDTSAFMKQNAKALKLRGGGPAGFVQGVAENIDAEQIQKSLLGFLKAQKG